MKTSDLKTGVLYAYKSHQYGQPSRVKVLTPAFDGMVKVKNGWGAERTERQKGVQVEFDGGRVEVVRPATLVSTWAQHLKEKKRAKAARAKYEAEQAAALKADAATVVALDALLRSKGATVRFGAYCYDDVEAAALREAGMPAAGRDDHNVDLAEGYEDEYVGDPRHFTSVFYDLSGALEGKFDLDALAVLVAPCYHEDCSDCGKAGKPCGRSNVSQPGHEACVGVSA